MKLDEVGITNIEWNKKNYQLPKFDRKKIAELTKKEPEWIHFGAGNIFRAFQANVVQKLLECGVLKKGLIVAEGYDYEIIEKIYRPYDNYHILVTLKSNGEIEKKVIGSIVESLELNEENSNDFNRLNKIFRQSSLKMASFTITEKGYSLVDNDNQYFGAVLLDMENGPKHPISYMGKITALLYERFKNGRYPIAMVSMDNCSHNGDKLFNAVNAFAKAWVANNCVPKEFIDYVKNPQEVSFPWTMIDKITPRPDNQVAKILEEDGIEDVGALITTKNTYTAPFVNAEESEYLVIEDNFPNGKIELTSGGVIYTDRITVDRVEKMKVCTCLNPLHTTLAIFGCLLGYNLISKEMELPVLKQLVLKIGYDEGLPVVVDPKIIDPEDFINEVINFRIPNPFMPDTPQRIATDTSQKLAIRFGETLKAYQANNLSVKELKYIPLVFAGWLRYLMGIDDNGDKFELSADPLLNTLLPHISNFTLTNDFQDVHQAVKPILSDERIFGIDLYHIGIGDLVEQYFSEMITSPGAVLKTIEKYVL